MESSNGGDINVGSIENSIEEDIKILEELRIANENCIKNAKNKNNPFVTIWEKQNRALEHILSDYKKLQEEFRQVNHECDRLEKIDFEKDMRIIELQKENEELKKDYYNVINKIENKIDRFDYEFEKAKKQNNKDKSDYYWDLITNFKKLLESEE